MLQVVREFRLTLLQLSAPLSDTLAKSDFQQTTLLVSACVESPRYVGTDLDRMMAEVSTTIGSYLRAHFDGRWFVDSDAASACAKRLKVPSARVPSGNTAQDFAEYLLVSGFEPLLRPQSLLCRAVEVRAPGHEAAVAMLPDELTDRYEKEIDPNYRAPKRRNAPFYVRKELPERGFGVKNQWSTTTKFGKPRPAT